MRSRGAASARRRDDAGRAVAGELDARAPPPCRAAALTAVADAAAVSSDGERERRPRRRAVSRIARSRSERQEIAQTNVKNRERTEGAIAILIAIFLVV